MSAGTKLFLAVFALLIAVLVVYYGVFQSGGTPAAPQSDQLQSAEDRAGHPARPSTAGDLPSIGRRTPASPTDTGLGRPAQTGGAPGAVRPVAGADREAFHQASKLVDELLAHPAEAPPAPALIDDPAAATVQQPASGAVAANPTEPVSTDPNPVSPGPGIHVTAASETASGAPPARANAPATTGADRRTPTASTASAVPNLNARSGSATEGANRRAQPSTVLPVTVTGPHGAARPGSAPAQPPPIVEYIVKSGDTMTSIAQEWFGDANKWSLIAKANPLVDPGRMHIGDKLKLPPKNAQPESVKDRLQDKSVYIVQSGDTLSKIARDYYGDVARWEQIYNANKAVIGDDPAELRPGMKLTLPPKTQAR